MKTTAVLLLLGFSALALSATMGPAVRTGQTPSIVPTTTTTVAPNTTTTTTTTVAPNTTTTTTLAPNTTTTTTTTVAPNTTTTTTTTVAPNTTTTTTTTVAPNTTTTTTIAPNTTTATTTVPTTTKPPVVTRGTVGNYTLEDNGKRCLMVQMELHIRLATDKAKGSFLLLPNKTSTAGFCNETHAELTLISDALKFTMCFIKNLTEGTTFVNRVTFTLTYDFVEKRLSTTTYKVDNQSVHFFNAQTGKSYSCKKESLDMGQGLFLDITQDHMQAFNFTKTSDFGPADLCKADQRNYRVAIAVGITLLVLVVVVVVAYLLARKKRNDGYQSL